MKTFLAADVASRPALARDMAGVIGAVVDHNRGTAYTYPTWIEMTFGQSLVFDRAQEEEGTVLKGYPAGSKSADATVGASGSTSPQCLNQLPGANCAK